MQPVFPIVSRSALRWLIPFLLGWLLIYPNNGNAQEQPADPNDTMQVHQLQVPVTEGSNDTAGASYYIPLAYEDKSPGTAAMIPLEFRLSIVLLIFGMLIILIELYIIKVRRLESDEILRLFLITLIIISTLYLITCGYSNDQIAPAVGLFGTIAGYLLGKTSKPKDNKTEHDEKS